MAVPMKKVSRSKRNQRRAHDAVGKTNLTECKNCGEPKLPHHVCKACGYYDGREIVDTAGLA